MKKLDGFVILKFVDVTFEQLAKLQEVISSEPVRRESVEPGRVTSRWVYAHIKSSSWDATHETNTVEVIVYDYAKWYDFTKDVRVQIIEGKPSGRWVVEKILDALQRLEGPEPKF